MSFEGQQVYATNQILISEEQQQMQGGEVLHLDLPPVNAEILFMRFLKEKDMLSGGSYL